MIRLDVSSGVTSAAPSGDAGAARTCSPRSWRIAYVRRSSGSRMRGLVADDVGERLLRGGRLRWRRDAAELERQVDEHDLVRSLGGRGDRDVRRDGRRADAALGAVDRDDPAGPGDGQRRRPR